MIKQMIIRVLMITMTMVLLIGCGASNKTSLTNTGNVSANVGDDITKLDEDAEDIIKNKVKENNVAKENEDDRKTQENLEDEQEIIENYEGKDINPLTGLWINEVVALRRPIGVMINNFSKAMPQSGIGQADIIYETLVEGGLSRLLAIFQDFDAKKIGPIRSARHYFVDFTFNHDALYVHYGYSPQAAQTFANLKPPHLDGLSYLDTIMCFQDLRRVRPHSTYTSYTGLLDAWKSKGYRTTLKEQFKTNFLFSKEEKNIDEGLIANKIIIPFSKHQISWFEYDESNALYNRFQFNGEHIDIETGKQLSYKNIIIQFAKIWAIKGDKEGRLDMNLITTGHGYYITNGKAEKITWKKTSHYSPTVYYNKFGEQLEMNRGKTWIAIFPSDSRKDDIIIE